jgi:FkbM family methyltransferase
MRGAHDLKDAMPANDFYLNGGEKVKRTIKNIIKNTITKAVDLMGKTAPGRYVYREIVSSAMARVQSVQHGALALRFAVPNALNQYRADTFSTKEPETLEWIDRIPVGSVLWDIGANVGLYSCYAAKAKVCRVFAFEPSVFNLELLARNLFLNAVTDKVTIVPLPLSERLANSMLKMTSTDWGGAMSTFGEDYGHDGEPIRKVFEFPTIGVSMIDAVQSLQILQPDYIKMDVDGIEHLILKGGMPILKQVKSVLIEINDQFTAQADDASSYLTEAGFTLLEKRHADYFDTVSGAPKYTFNQIWTRAA